MAETSGVTTSRCCSRSGEDGLCDAASRFVGTAVESSDGSATSTVRPAPADMMPRMVVAVVWLAKEMMSLPPAPLTVLEEKIPV